MSSAGPNSPVEAASADKSADMASEAAHQDSAGNHGELLSSLGDQPGSDIPHDAWGVDPATGALIGDTLAASDTGGDLAELHAALASLSNDAFAYLDIALDHLTSSSDLFDAPAMDFGDFGGDSTGS